ncbi:MAG: hypothetical protein Kow00120_28140 [Anaerolineae bacterium]
MTQFGLILPNYDSPANTPAGLRAAAQAAEAAGFDSVWTTDHVLVPDVERAAPYKRLTEALMTLGYLAGLTERVRLGTSVIVLPMRNPVLLAKQVAALDYLSGGRVTLGVGVGWNATEYGYLNADFKRRGRRADEYIQAMRALWQSGEYAEFHGETVSFSGAVFNPKPVQPGGPPIWIGGVSDAALRRAATFGDGWQPSGGIEPEGIADAVSRLRQMAGQRRLTISARFRVDLSAGAEAAIARVRAYLSAGVEYPVVHLPHDSADDLAARIAQFGREVIPAVGDD